MKKVKVIKVGTMEQIRKRSWPLLWDDFYETRPSTRKAVVDCMRDSRGTYLRPHKTCYKYRLLKIILKTIQRCGDWVLDDDVKILTDNQKRAYNAYLYHLHNTGTNQPGTNI